MIGNLTVKIQAENKRRVERRNKLDTFDERQQIKTGLTLARKPTVRKTSYTQLLRELNLENSTQNENLDNECSPDQKKEGKESRRPSILLINQEEGISRAEYESKDIFSLKGDNMENNDEFKEEKKFQNFMIDNSRETGEISHFDMSKEIEANSFRLLQTKKLTKKEGGLKKMKKLNPIKEGPKRKTARQRLKISKLIILPDDKIRYIWDLLILLILSYTIFITPYRIAMIDDDDECVEWIVVDSLVDLIFTIDIFMNFISAYYNEDDNLILSRREITSNYLKRWFFIDFISILPVSYFFNTEKNYTSLARLARLPRLYRVIKLAKIVRIMKMNSHAKNAEGRNNMFIGKGFERIFFLLFVFGIICHVVACFWVILAKIEGISPQTWIMRYEFEDASNFELYIAALYWSVLSITVGFSDYSGTTSERFFQIIVTLIGIIAVSFVIGSLTSVLYSIDSGQIELKEKLGILERLRKENRQLDDDLYRRVRKTIKYQHKKRDEEKVNFLKDLPTKTRNDLAFIIYQNQIKKFPFFKDKSKNFVSHITQFLKPLKVLGGTYVYEEGDPAEDIYFLIQGKVSFIFQDRGSDIPFLEIEDGKKVAINGVGYYFGELEMQDMDLEVERRRIFSLMATTDVELLVLPMKDVMDFREEHKITMSKLFERCDEKIERIRQLKARAERDILEEKDIEIEKLDEDIFSDLMMGKENFSESEKIQNKFAGLEKEMNSVMNTINTLHKFFFLRFKRDLVKKNSIMTQPDPQPDPSSEIDIQAKDEFPTFQKNPSTIEEESENADLEKHTILNSSKHDSHESIQTEDFDKYIEDDQESYREIEKELSLQPTMEIEKNVRSSACQFQKTKDGNNIISKQDSRKRCKTLQEGEFDDILTKKSIIPTKESNNAMKKI